MRSIAYILRVVFHKTQQTGEQQVSSPAPAEAAIGPNSRGSPAAGDKPARTWMKLQREQLRELRVEGMRRRRKEPTNGSLTARSDHSSHTNGTAEAPRTPKDSPGRRRKLPTSRRLPAPLVPTDEQRTLQKEIRSKNSELRGIRSEQLRLRNPRNPASLFSSRSSRSNGETPRQGLSSPRLDSPGSARREPPPSSRCQIKPAKAATDATVHV